ncbi:unnamed protein product [Diatraea saccharalis]|uniref:Uncharacterized protein n=1 Tax=Diatraea saccharalis TaxID=40085 RepID=A0A9N9QTC9_9NEOP|nr:unnamed protein product [Diatraea saccharalis]
MDVSENMVTTGAEFHYKRKEQLMDAKELAQCEETEDGRIQIIIEPLENEDDTQICSAEPVLMPNTSKTGIILQNLELYRPHKHNMSVQSVVHVKEPEKIDLNENISDHYAEEHAVVLPTQSNSDDLQPTITDIILEEQMEVIRKSLEGDDVELITPPNTKSSGHCKKSTPTFIAVKYSMKEGSESELIQVLGKQKTVNTKLYKTNLPITKTKYNDLKKLCETGVIPKIFQREYLNFNHL